MFLGVSRSAKGYSLISILETLKTFSVEDGLTEEALVTKLRTCRCHYLFLHTSLKHNSSGVHFLPSCCVFICKYPMLMPCIQMLMLQL